METDFHTRRSAGPQGRAITVVFCGFIAFAYGFGVYLFPVLGPDMKQELGFSYSQMGYVAAGIQAGFILSSILSGMLAPKIGELRCIFGSMALCGAFLIALSWVETSLQAAAILTLIGFVPAASWIPMVAVIRRFIPYDRRGAVFGFLSGGSGYGAIVNGQVVPLLQDDLGWRGVWLTAGATVLLFTLVGMFAFRMMAIVDETEERSPRNTSDAQTIDAPDRSTLKMAAHLWLIMLLGAAIMISFQTFFTALIRDHLDADRALAGRMTFLHGCLGVAAAPMIGFLADRFNVRVCFMGVAACALGACMSMYLATSIDHVIVGALFFGFAFYPFFALPPAYASKTMETGTAVRVFAVGNVFVGGGALLGNMSGGVVLRIFDALPAVFAWLSVLTLALIALIVALPRERMNSDA